MWKTYEDGTRVEGLGVTAAEEPGVVGGSRHARDAHLLQRQRQVLLEGLGSGYKAT